MENWLKPTDQLWECSTGRHFFHYLQPYQVAEQVFGFWRSEAFPADRSVLQASTSEVALVSSTVAFQSQ